jgi:hypothetical protein
MSISKNEGKVSDLRAFIAAGLRCLPDLCVSVGRLRRFLPPRDLIGARVQSWLSHEDIAAMMENAVAELAVSLESSTRSWFSAATPATDSR